MTKSVQCLIRCVVEKWYTRRSIHLVINTAGLLRMQCWGWNKLHKLCHYELSVKWPCQRGEWLRSGLKNQSLDRLRTSSACHRAKRLRQAEGQAVFWREEQLKNQSSPEGALNSSTKTRTGWLDGNRQKLTIPYNCFLAPAGAHISLCDIPATAGAQCRDSASAAAAAAAILQASYANTYILSWQPSSLLCSNQQ